MKDDKRKNLDEFHLKVFFTVFNDLKLQRNYTSSLKARFPQTYAYINNRFKKLDGHKFGEKCYWLIHKLDDFLSCPICGNPICCFNNILKGYASTCSLSCGAEFKTLKFCQQPKFIISYELDQKFKDELLALKLDLHSNRYMNAIIKQLPDAYNYVYFRYDILKGHKMPEKIYWFLNGLNDFQKCKICGKDIVDFLNAAIGYPIYHNECKFEDPTIRQKISDAFARNVEKDPDFNAKCEQKRRQTRVKNGHSPTWNNSQKTAQTRIQHGIDDPEWKADVARRSKKTRIERYGEDDWNCMKKNKQTCLKRYGMTSYSKTEEFLEKCKATNNKNFGTDFVMQSERGKQLLKQAMQEKYGVDNYAQTQAYKDLWKSQDFVDARQQKTYETKRKNRSFNTSKPEDDSYRFLCIVFGKDDIIRQYKDNIRYPFNCDFYIKSLDLFIECNYHWTHGKHPFDENDPNDIKHLEFLNQKNNEKINNGQEKNLYQYAIDVWTKRDPQKINIAKQNQLNYLMFYSIIDLKSYLNDLIICI